MALVHEDQENVEQLKAFWQKYGNAITVVALIAALIYTGFFLWRWWQAKRTEEASKIFLIVENSINQGFNETTERAWNELKAKYPNTYFSITAGLAVATISYRDKKYETAKKTLQWIIDQNEPTSISDSARYRLSAILVDEGKYDEALKLIENSHSASMNAIFAERRADIFYLKGNKDAARENYLLALKEIPQNNPSYLLVESKLVHSGGSVS